MKSSKPWEIHLNRDDRQLLSKIIDSSGEFSVLRTLIGPYLFSSIRSLHFSRSNRVGLDVPQDSLSFLSEQFLKWMAEKDEWSRLNELWSVDKKGPWSLPYFIYRSYYRFRRENFPQGVQGEVSYSGQASCLELEGGTFSGLAQPILEAFSFVTQSLPEELRLYYQLHLEGLLASEIAALLNADACKVKKKIALAKEYLDSDESSAGVGS